MHETWEAFARDIHFARPKNVAYAILDSRLFDIPGFERAIRSDVPPYQSETVEGLAAQIGIPARQLRQTIDAFNAAATGDAARFDATRCDGLAASSALNPPKSNWARAIDRPPYLAYPLVGGLAYTFGGLATNERAEVQGRERAYAGPLCGGRDHRAFLRHRAECRFGASRAGVRQDRRTAGGGFPANQRSEL